ncbi:fatty acid desaturase family protein [Mucilaginibacter arboris]|uniref:Fatty acid desaturase n=1 Tax=Mucilaginibacter arboris TaxID=2682090 RepID=A0A7K1SXA2_9SPHI|nr:acyl-CoA desaturase [Mucilaginibacter arboris]MVN21965.1 fatty acid desaturase [Mucilaginibacter arboris]
MIKKMNNPTINKPVFKKAGNDDFLRTLQKEVNEQVLANKSLQQLIVFKSLSLIVLYFLFYSCILIFGNQTPLLFAFYVLTGFTMILVFLNGFHDAAHGAIFKKRKHNNWFTYILELFGSSNFIWKKRHLLLHHPYPNMQNWDIDIKQSDLVRLFPGSTWLNIHRYQHIYMWFLYFFYSLNWIFVRDFKDIFGTRDNYLKRVVTIPKYEAAKLVAVKLFNIFYMIIVPMLVLAQPWYMVLYAFLVMHLSASAFGVMALLSTHVNEDSVFPMSPADGKMDITWSMYQITVTQDFSTESKLANFLFGGFNHHVAHHLFPTVAHTYYPAITPIIRKYAKNYNLPYQAFSLYKALRSHYTLLKNNAQEENLFVTGEL